MTQASADSAARRAQSTADRLTELRARLDRLDRGEPTTPEDVERAREQARTQAEAVTGAWDRLVDMHRSAAARHEEHAERLQRAGRIDAAEREREAARRAYAHIARLLSAPPPAGSARSAAPAAAPPAAAPPGPEPEVSSDEVARLREGLTALLASAGSANLDEADRRREWSRLVVEQCRTKGWRSWTQAVCVVAATVLAPVRGVALTVVGGSGADFRAASGGWAARAQELELIVGEGPSTTAHLGNRVVIVDDLTTERHAWQLYASASSTLGIRGVCALPLLVRGGCVGSLTLYHRASISEQAEVNPADAGAFADIAAAGLLADFEEMRHGGDAGQDQFIVHVATGTMVVRLRISPEEAEARLRAHAFATGSSLAEVARQVVAGEDLG